MDVLYFHRKMTGTKTGGICPICRGAYRQLNVHLRDLHKVTNDQERRLLNAFATGIFHILDGPCPIRDCFRRGQNVQKHIQRAHPDLMREEKDTILTKARLRALFRALAELRASNPDPPMVSTLDLQEDSDDDEPCQNPACLLRVQRLEGKITRLEGENARLKVKQLLHFT